MRPLDLVGHKYGQLTVLQRDKNTPKQGTQWLCKCDCENTTVVTAVNLRSGHTQSCGCLQKRSASVSAKSRKLPNNQAHWNYIWQIYKYTAKKRNYYFELTPDEVKELCLGECWYCGRPASEADRNGIDRVDNEEGYTIDNVVSCCKRCNTAKNDMSAPDYLAHCERVVQYNNSINF